MTATRPADHDDANLILKLYDLRREKVMREARDFFHREFLPKSLKDVQEVLQMDHPKNAYFRQVTSYWEMAANFVNRGILDPQMFADNCGEGLFVFARLEPYLEELRKSYYDKFLQELDQAIQNFEPIKAQYEPIRAWNKEASKS